MTSHLRLLGLALIPLLLSGCTTPTPPAPTVTVTVSPAAPSPKPGDAAPWDLHAVCAAHSEAETLINWRDQQTEAGRLTKAQSAAVLQAIAVQYLEFNQAGLTGSVREDVTALANASGTLEHPKIDLDSKAVQSARSGLSRTCHENNLTIGRHYVTVDCLADATSQRLRTDLTALRAPIHADIVSPGSACAKDQDRDSVTGHPCSLASSP